jgi:exopolysaccharide production protein ExoZ
MGCPAAQMSQIRSIQILRAAAALSVVFGHLQSEALTMPAASTHGYAPVLLDLTGAGVDLFFVISGFVMVYASQDLFMSADGSWRFLKRRIARIVPLYWSMTTLFLLTLVAMPHALSSAAPRALETLTSYLFIPYAHAGSDVIRPVYKLGWTLEYEMFFYLVFAALLFLPMRAALYGIGGLFTGLVALGAILAPSPGAFAFWSDPIIFEFLMGALIAVAFIDGHRMSRGGMLALLIAGICGFAVTTASGLDAHGPWRPLLWGLPAALILSAAVLRDEAPAAAGYAMSALVLLGDASYALYLLHPMVIRPLRLMWDHAGLSATASPWSFIALGILVVVPVAIVVHLWIERPMTKFARRLLSARQSAAPKRAYNES